MDALRVAGLVGAIWFTASIVLAVGWTLARRGGWRGATEVPPQPWHRDQLGIVRQDGEF